MPHDALLDTLGYLVALRVTPADLGDWAELARLSTAVQAETGDGMRVGFVD